LRNVVESASSDPSIAMDENDWNMEPHLISIKNGILNLETLQFESDPKIRIREYIDISWNPHARSTMFDNYLLSVFLEQEIVDWIKLAIGYTFTGFTKEQIFFLCEGEGTNGKSKFLDLLKV